MFIGSFTLQIVHATLDNYEQARHGEDADIRAESHHNWVDEVVRCEGRGGTVVSNDNRLSCLTIQPRPEVKDPSLLNRYYYSRVCLQEFFLEHLLQVLYPVACFPFGDFSVYNCFLFPHNLLVLLL